MRYLVTKDNQLGRVLCSDMKEGDVTEYDMVEWKGMRTDIINIKEMTDMDTQRDFGVMEYDISGADYSSDIMSIDCIALVKDTDAFGSMMIRNFDELELYAPDVLHRTCIIVSSGVTCYLRNDKGFEPTISHDSVISFILQGNTCLDIYSFNGECHTLDIIFENMIPEADYINLYNIRRIELLSLCLDADITLYGSDDIMPQFNFNSEVVITFIEVDIISNSILNDIAKAVVNTPVLMKSDCDMTVVAYRDDILDLRKFNINNVPSVILNMLAYQEDTFRVFVEDIDNINVEKETTGKDVEVIVIDNSGREKII